MLHSDYSGILSQLVGELDPLGTMALESVADLDNDGVYPFKAVLSKIKTPLLIIIDGLDKLQSLENLKWLPKEFPEHIRVIVTTSPGPALFATKQKDWTPLFLEPLSAQERGEFVQHYFSMVTCPFFWD